MIKTPCYLTLIAFALVSFLKSDVEIGSGNNTIDAVIVNNNDTLMEIENNVGILSSKKVRRKSTRETVPHSTATQHITSHHSRTHDDDDNEKG